jgi:hypothetical protein
MTLTHNPRAVEYLLQGIASARSTDELTRMRRLARAHYSGLLLMELEHEIELRSRELDRRATRVRPQEEAQPGG